jgi:hypothetical protein
MMLTLLFPNNAFLDKLPSDIRENAITLTNLFKEKAIIPLVESDTTHFEEKFAQACYHLLNVMYNLSRLIESKYPRELDISSNLIEPLLIGLDELRRDYSNFNDLISLTMMDAIDVVENYIRQVLGSTASLSPDYYFRILQYYVSLSVCMAALDLVKKNKRPTKEEIINLLVDRCDEITRGLNQLINAIQIEEDKQAIIEGRSEYAKGKAERFRTVDDMLKALDNT